MENCSKNGIKRFGESCTLNNNCIYPKCMEELKNNNMKEIKNLFYDLLLFGHTISEDKLIVMLSLLYDKSFDEEYDMVELNGCSLFVEKSVSYFLAAKKDITQMDKFIEYYKELLLKDENYELVQYLSL